MKVFLKKIKASAESPRYMSEGAAGCDVTACLESTIRIDPLERVAVPTGLAVAIPSGYEIQVRPRSGLAFKSGLTVVNAPGTIDSDYRGEVKVLMVNLSQKTVIIEPGQRIAQLVLNQVDQIQWEETDSLPETQRAEGGFGSTGA